MASVIYLTCAIFFDFGRSLKRYTFIGVQLPTNHDQTNDRPRQRQGS
jgi:hypothetical protein